MVWGGDADMVYEDGFHNAPPLRSHLGGAGPVVRADGLRSRSVCRSLKDTIPGRGH